MFLLADSIRICPAPARGARRALVPARGRCPLLQRSPKRGRQAGERRAHGQPPDAHLRWKTRRIFTAAVCLPARVSGRDVRRGWRWGGRRGRLRPSGRRGHAPASGWTGSTQRRGRVPSAQGRASLGDRLSPGTIRPTYRPPSPEGEDRGRPRPSPQVRLRPGRAGPGPREPPLGGLGNRPPGQRPRVLPLRRGGGRRLGRGSALSLPRPPQSRPAAGCPAGNHSNGPASSPRAPHSPPRGGAPKGRGRTRMRGGRRGRPLPRAGYSQTAPSTPDRRHSQRYHHVMPSSCAGGAELTAAAAAPPEPLMVPPSGVVRRPHKGLRSRPRRPGALPCGRGGRSLA